MAKKEKVKPKKQLNNKKVVPGEGIDLAQKESMAKTIPEFSIPHEEEEIPFHIVGIGASAGGLDAFETFFTNMPHDNGMAFILITHLNPGHVSVMPDLIKKYTRMKVHQIEDGMKVEPNCVFVTPPNKDIAILNGTLQLMEPAEPRGLRLPIDYFLRSLAHDQTDHAIGIIFSGSGSDGALGMREIKAELGMTMVQDPDSARYDSMPRSSIATGIIDYILPVEKMPEQLLKYVKHIPIPQGQKPLEKEVISGDIQKILIILRNQTGQDFSFYKKNTIQRRIERRMNVHQIDSHQLYLRFLQQNPQEAQSLFDELLIGVTSFFRDPEAFEVLKTNLSAHILKDRSDDYPIRVWIPGCSSGEEVYSLAMIFQECMEELGKKFNVQMFGTDIDAKAINRARAGIYPVSISSDVPHSRLNRFFVKKEGNYQVRKEIREMVVFAPQNVIKDPPFIKLDLLSCRNLLIYLESEVQKKLLPFFHYSINEGGLLFLGTSETIGEFTDLFSQIDKKWKIFQRRPAAASTRTIIELPPMKVPEKFPQLPVAEEFKRTGIVNVNQMAERIIMEHLAPPCAIVDKNGDILYIHGKTGKYLEPAPGEMSVNILKMAREGLKAGLVNAFRKASTKQEVVVLKGLEVKTNGDIQLINLTLKPIRKLETASNLVLIVFEDITAEAKEIPDESTKPSSPQNDKRVEELEQELHYTKQYLQGTIEELETSNEELKSANEELQSTNEELQSTNEELETSQEELQSLNEEHVTLNAELQRRIDSLSQANNDMKNLLESTEIATIFLDNDLCITRFTSQATEIINLIPSDVCRPMSDIVTKIKYENLTQDAQEVLKTLVFKEKEVQANNGHWYLMRMRPYRTIENVINGLVLTFVNIQEQKKSMEKFEELNKAYLEALEFSEAIIDTMRASLMILDKDLVIKKCNHTFYQTFQVSSEETEGKFIYELGNRQWDIPQLRKLLDEIIPQDNTFKGFLVEHTFPQIGLKKMLLNAHRIVSKDESKVQILLAIEDITEKG